MSWLLKGIKKIWTGYSEDQQRYYEAKLVHKWGGLTAKEVQIHDIPISKTPEDTIHCISVTSGEKIPLVLVPGYGASGGLYYKLMKKLSGSYDLHIVDMRGMGCSGRPEFPAKTQADTEKYLLEGLDKWRQQMGIKKFILCGHSLGGYVATKYAHNNPDKVMALMLISPAGMWPIPSNFHKEMEGFLKTIGCIKRNIFKKASAYWAPGKSPLQLLRNFGRSSIFVLKSYVNWFPALQEQEKADMKEYLFHILMKPGTGELAMPYLLHPVYYAKSKEFE